MLKVLIIFSDPSDQTRLRFDKEDKIISNLSKRFGDRVSIERHHASEITDIHALITFGSFDVMQFSGHSDCRGVYVEKSSSYSDSELVVADQLLRLIDLAERPPRLAIFLSCYSEESMKLLSQAAPFVITADAQVGDAECTEFICGFYEWLFSGFSITLSFDHAIQLLQAKGLKSDNLKLSRRGLVTKGNTIYVRCSPQNHRDSILVNLDGVSHKLDYMGMEKEDLLHLIARKLAVHYWIFDGARDDAIIPIGNLLFGSFSWKNSSDIVYCTDLMRLAPSVSETHWKLWAALLISYNDLASSKYRSLQYPADPHNSKELQDAVSIFEYHIEKYLLRNVDTLKNIGFDNVLPQIAFVEAECTQAIDQMALKRYSRVVTALESALTHYHEVVTATMPPSAVGEIPLGGRR
jgi:hypothetical protein